MKTLFITGTDTDAGKSLVTAACLYGIKQQGFRVLGYKPVAAGASLVSSSWVNEDAKLLAAHSSEVLNPSDINPFCFQPAMLNRCVAIWRYHNWYKNDGLRIPIFVLDSLVTPNNLLDNLHLLMQILR